MDKTTKIPTKKEFEKLKRVLDEIEESMHWAYKNLSGGFVTADMFDFDNEYFDVEIKEGVQNDVENRVYTCQVKVDRKTFEVID